MDYTDESLHRITDEDTYCWHEGRRRAKIRAYESAYTAIYKASPIECSSRLEGLIRQADALRRAKRIVGWFCTVSPSPTSTSCPHEADSFRGVINFFVKRKPFSEKCMVKFERGSGGSHLHAHILLPYIRGRCHAAIDEWARSTFKRWYHPDNWDVFFVLKPITPKGVSAAMKYLTKEGAPDIIQPEATQYWAAWQKEEKTEKREEKEFPPPCAHGGGAGEGGESEAEA